MEEGLKNKILIEKKAWNIWENDMVTVFNSKWQLSGYISSKSGKDFSFYFHEINSNEEVKGIIPWHIHKYSFQEKIKNYFIKKIEKKRFSYREFFIEDELNLMRNLIRRGRRNLDENLETK